MLCKVSGFHGSPTPSELCGYFIGVAQLAAVLLWSHSKARGDVCCVVSVLPSRKAEACARPASAGDPDLACPLGYGIPVDSPAFFSWGEPSVLHPRLARTKPSRERAACDAPFAGEA